MRRCITNFEQVAVTAAQTLVSLIPATGKTVCLLRAWVSASPVTEPTAQQIAVRIRYLPATVTVGSGGGAGTVSPMDVGDTGITTTSRINDTTSPTTNGTAVVLYEDGAHIANGAQTPPLWAAVPFSGPIAIPSTYLIWELLNNPAASVTLSGGMEFIEIG
jgi:hypothetical protein